jgi:ATP-dependent RNA helicase SUPV3L1/SUV3
MNFQDPLSQAYWCVSKTDVFLLDAQKLKYIHNTIFSLQDKFEDLASLDGGYFLCNLESQKALSDLIEDIPLTLRDRYILIAAPANANDNSTSSVFVTFAKHISQGEECLITETLHLPKEAPKTTEKLKDLEGQHKAIMLYIWLRYSALILV